MHCYELIGGLGDAATGDGDVLHVDGSHVLVIIMFLFMT